LRPVAWKLYRFSLVAGGLAWICIASTLCGCSSANGFAKNASGRRYYNKGEYSVARSEFERALMDSPYNSTYAYNVGKAMEKEGDVSGAEQMYQHALTLDPTHQPSYHGLSELMVSQGRSQEAGNLLTAWSQTQPYSAESRVELAQMQRKAGNYAAAEQEINTALQIRPRFRQALNERSRIYQVTGRPAKGGAYSELALTSRVEPMAMQPQQGMAFATPQTSAALNMASTMPQNDPTLSPGIMQAGYGHPQMSSMASPMMSSAPQQMYQTNMFQGQMSQGEMLTEQMAGNQFVPGAMPASAVNAGPSWSPAPDMNMSQMPSQMMPSQMMPASMGAGQMFPGQMMPPPQGVSPIQPVMYQQGPQGMIPGQPGQPMQAGYAPQMMGAMPTGPMPIPQPVSQQYMPTPTQFGPTGMSSVPASPVQHPIQLGQPTTMLDGAHATGMQNISYSTDAPAFAPATSSSTAPTVQAF